ncbi:MAG: hypothetical protein P4L99_21895 [Chthoniobacter sp.]|nr:hypothetical protein [Chthoniobacter sp.]
MSYPRRKFSRPGFTPGQQPALRLYLAMAWAAHCETAGLSVSARCAKSKRCGKPGECAYCAWYEGVLVKATGHRSTTKCTATGDYEALMRDLEMIHGQSIVWQVKAAGGNMRRLEWMLAEARPGKGYTLEYLRGVAKRALRLDYYPDLETLSAEDRGTVLDAWKAMGKKEQDWQGNPEPEATEVEDPF